MNTFASIIKHFESNLDIFTTTLFIIVLEILFRFLVGFEGITLQVFIFSFAIAILLTSPMYLMGKKTRLGYSFLLLLFLGALFFAQTLHYEFFRTFFSVSKISILKEAFLVKGEASAKISWPLFLYFIPCLLTFIITLIKGPQIKYTWCNKILATLVVFIIGLGAILFIPSTYTTNTKMSKSDSFLYETQYNRVKSIDRLGFYSSTIRDIELYMKPYDEENNKYLADMYFQDYSYISESNEYTGMFEGKNLILILCESLSPVVINEGLTPTLYKMKTEGISFNNNYAPVFQSATADSEFISLTGLIPSIENGPLAYDFFENSFPMALPWKFTEQGYSSNSFHSFKKDFYNRETLHYSYGFTYLYDWNDLGFQKREEFVEAMNWMHDKELLEKTLAITNQDATEPFFDFVISVSGHVPYIRGRYELADDFWQTVLQYGEVGEKYSEEALAYFAAQRTLESGLTALIEGLSSTGQLENTVIALYGDHYPYGLTQSAQDEIFGKDPGISLYQTPFIIWTPDIEPIAVENVTSTFDIYPTLANLFNLDINGQMIVGRDALSDSQGFVLFPDTSWLNDRVYYNATTQKTTPLSGTMSFDEMEDMNEKIYDLIQVSQIMLTSDYFSQDNK